MASHTHGACTLSIKCLHFLISIVLKKQEVVLRHVGVLSPLPVTDCLCKLWQYATVWNSLHHAILGKNANELKMDPDTSSSSAPWPFLILNLNMLQEKLVLESIKINITQHRPVQVTLENHTHTVVLLSLRGNSTDLIINAANEYLTTLKSNPKLSPHQDIKASPHSHTSSQRWITVWI